MIGQRVHQYLITEKLGEGGMGVVYRAEDTRLQRPVALKFLNPLLVATPEDQQRLVGEARAAAGLSHPNICTIYEINEIDGRVFIAMQFVEGTTLRDRVLSGQIETGEALRFLLQVVDGLREAHTRGIVHRDMKSSNIMITPSGRAVIMDFGLARPAGQGRIDERFSSRGTSAYMSPEQARGDAVDQRSDIWSLGVTLFEMLAGKLPFQGDYEQAVMHAILHEAPHTVDEWRPDLPASVRAIVERCLRKNPAERYQSLDELMLALRRAQQPGRERPGRARIAGLAVAAILTLVAGFTTYDFIRGRQAGGGQRVPIAVIDVNNETEDPALDGMSGMLITALEQSQRLSVMTRSRMFDIARTLGAEDVERIDESLGQRICEAAGVDALVIPTVRRFGDLYTVDLKVLHVRHHKYIHTQKEEARGLESIPHLVDDLARGIRIDLREASEAVERTQSVVDVTTTDLEAYQAYFEGEELLNKLDFPAAGRAFARAIRTDSTFALAYYRLAYTEWWSRGRAEDARGHVNYAVAHLNRMPLKERYLVRALKAALDDGFEAQLPILTEMRTLYPDDKEMLFGLGDAEFHSAHYDSAAAHFRAALAIDPVMERALQHLTWTELSLSRYDRARDTALRWVDVAGSAESYENLATAQLWLGNTDAAMSALDTAERLDPKDPKVASRRAGVYFALGNMDAAMRSLDEADRLAVDREPIVHVETTSMRAGVIYPYLGRYRDALALMEKRSAAAFDAYQDSSVVIAGIGMRARLTQRAYGDVERTRAVIAELDALPADKRDRAWRDAWLTFHLTTGDSAGVRADLSRAREDFAPSKQAYYRTFVLASAGDCDAARAAEKQLPPDALRGLEPRGAYAYALGHCLVEHGDPAGAIALLKPLLDRKLLLPGLAVHYAPAWYDLGRAYEATGRGAEARACYERVLTMWANGDNDLPVLLAARAGRDRLAGVRAM